MKKKNFDIVIVGQGIAGTILAFKLIQMNKSVLVVDSAKDNERTASKIALGIYNPLVLKWITKSWKADEQVEELFGFCDLFEKVFNKKINYKKNIYRVLHTNYEVNNWKSKQGFEKLSSYISPNLKKLHISDQQFGVVLKSGWVDVQMMLSVFLNFLKENEFFLNEQFDYKEIHFSGGSICYKDIECQKMIFCEGCSVLNNPFFSDLKIKPTKGETIKVQSEKLGLNKIIHTGVITIPLGRGVYHIGSTFDSEDDESGPTEKAKNELIKKVPFLNNVEYKIISHEAAYRPATYDRKPILGVHKKYNNIFILNGLGSRGILHTPYLSKELINYLFYEKEINPEININRFL